MSPRIVIVGAGQAGAWVARSLRLAGSPADIVLIGAERHLPYERPPLSKKVMLEGDTTGLEICGSEELHRLRIDLRSSETVVGVDRRAKVVCTEAGRSLSYDKLVLTTGGRSVRCLAPGFNLPDVFTLRSLEDALGIAGRLRPGARILVVGGGWIGLETAAAARQKGAHVTVVECGRRLCARSVPPLISDRLRESHVEQGVNVLLNKSVRRLIAANHGLLADVSGIDEPIAVDTVVVGIGMVPNVELAAEAGLDVNNGIVVDGHGCTSDPDIYAAGDVTSQPSAQAGRHVRLESWANAQNQAIAVGRTLAGSPQRHEDIPWFWSDQYGVHLQILGFPDADAELIVRGNPSGTSFCAFQLQQRRLSAVVAWNRARELKIAKRLMAARVDVCTADLTNEAIRLETLVS